MDNTDLQILRILQKKARIPNVEVARTIGMAPSAVLERIKKLEAKGIIEGYEVRLNPDMFRCTMIAFVHMRVKEPSQFPEAGQAVAAIDQVQEVHHLAGEDCLMAKLRVADNKELESILTNQIGKIESIIETRTQITLSSYKESAKIMIPETA
ncbi:MAG: Lrp/AsnC family transcriptional regulator [Desulfobacterales bacterium]|nr:Lrp/AsnC family transcriptional regulator [Desulfobacterales bacterium]